MKIWRNQNGVILPFILTVVIVMMGLGVAIAGIAVSNIRTAAAAQNSQEALNIAEGGLNYYLWHLAHNPTDYQDGRTGQPGPPYGPFTHDFKNVAGKKIGTFALTITPPPNGSTITTVKVVGQVVNTRGATTTGKRTLQAQLGQPSFASYAWLSNSEMIFSTTSTTNGPVFSNSGIEFDGTNNGPVQSAVAQYQASSCGCIKAGVWGSGGPASLWQYPVTQIPFANVTANLSAIKTLANQAGGVCLGSAASGCTGGSASGGIGFYLQLQSDGTIKKYRVNSENAGCSTSVAACLSTSLIGTIAAPTNGIIFSTENLWISGTSWPKRTTIAAAKLPDPGSAASRLSIKIIGNLTYAAKDGSDVLGLIAQQDIFIPKYITNSSPNVFEVDAALLAQNGSIGFDTSSPYSLKNSFLGYG